VIGDFANRRMVNLAATGGTVSVLGLNIMRFFAVAETAP
jgi:hypothetical protein